MNITKPIRKSNITVNEVGNETMLYGADQRAVHVLNPTAKLVWELCDGEHSLADMEQALRSNFNVSVEHDVAADIKQTLAVFSSKALLEE